MFFVFMESFKRFISLKKANSPQRTVYQYLILTCSIKTLNSWNKDNSRAVNLNCDRNK